MCRAHLQDSGDARSPHTQLQTELQSFPKKQALSIRLAVPGKPESPRKACAETRRVVQPRGQLDWTLL
jgi:hypothetical protein